MSFGMKRTLDGLAFGETGLDFVDLFDVACKLLGFAGLRLFLVELGWSIFRVSDSKSRAHSDTKAGNDTEKSRCCPSLKFFGYLFGYSFRYLFRSGHKEPRVSFYSQVFYSRSAINASFGSSTIITVSSGPRWEGVGAL